MKLSIIIVNYRAWPHIDKALAALRAGFPEDWEIIIVDNETDSDSFDEFQRAHRWVTMVANPANSGFGTGCIIGVRHARGARYLFMNPDVIASVADIRRLVDIKSEHPDIAILAPRQVGNDGRPQKVFDEFPSLLNQSKVAKVLVRLLAPRHKPDPRAEHRHLVYCDWVTGSFLLIDRVDYERLGGWSPDYWMYAEDADLCKRAHDAGLKVAYTPDVTVTHAHGGSSRINVKVKAMTKLEVIISKHVYASNHARGIERYLMHFEIVALRIPGLLLMSLLDLLTLRRFATLRVRSQMLTGLVGYYMGVLRSDSWLSPRAKANQT